MRRMLQAAIAVAIIWGAPSLPADPAMARDRPGGPANIRAYECGRQLSQPPAVCVVFDNHASEEVRFLTEITVDGQPVDARQFANQVECLNERGVPSKETVERYCAKREEVGWAYSCKLPLGMTRPTHSCIAQRSILLGPLNNGTGTTHGKTGDLAEDGWGIQPEGMKFTNLTPGSTYCFRFAAIRASDHVWSEAWTEWACAVPRPYPPKPTPVRNIKIQCLPAEWDGSSKDKALPHRILVTWEGGENSSRFVVEIAGKEHTVDVTGKPGDHEIWLEIPKEQLSKCLPVPEICAANVSGQVCTRTLQDVDIFPSVTKGTPASAGALLPEPPKLKPGGSSAAATILEAASPCVGGKVVDGTCRCPEGEIAKRFSDRNVCMPGLSSSSTGGGPAANAVVPAKPTVSAPPPIQAACTGGRFGTPPNCRCPDGLQWTGRACLQLAVDPPVEPCGPGLTYLQGRCVQLAVPQPKVFDSGVPFDWRRRPPKPPLTGGGSDGTQKVGGPAPTPLPPAGTGATIPPLGTSGGVLKPGGSGAAQALRCVPPQTLNREGRCVCANGMLGANCDQSHSVR
jgi:hypothetical protein